MAAGFLSILKAFRARSASFVSPTTSFYANNSNADLSCDRQGNLWTREAIGPQIAGTGGFTYQAVPGDDASNIVATAGSVLTQVGGFNDSGGIIYVQLHDRAIAPVAGNAPVMTFYVPSGASFSWSPSRGGRLFTNQIWFVVSSTRDTYTVLATPIFLYAEGYTP